MTELELRTYWSAQRLEDFVDRLATHPPSRVADIARAELVEIVRRVMPTDPEWDGGTSAAGDQVEERVNGW